MSNSLIGKENSFLDKFKKWIKNKWEQIFNNTKKLGKGEDIAEQEHSNVSISEDTKLQINGDEESCLMPDLPSFLPLIPVEDNKDDISKKQKVLYKKLAKYGITKEEWEEIEKYKGSAYFLPTTILHGIDLYKYNMPRYGGIFENVDFFDPQKIIDSYCKIYSAMYKFGKRNVNEVHIYRVDSDLFSNEMKLLGETASLLSFSRNYYQFKFLEGKNEPILINGKLEPGIPCIDFSELTGDSEAEVLLPPFLNVDLQDSQELLEDSYPIYSISIGKETSKPLDNDEKEEMELLRKTITDSQIPYEYYSHWYDTITHMPFAQGDDEKSVMLRQEFFKWQENLKKYLKLRFKEIEHEIDYPNIKPTDFLKWGLQRGKHRVGDFKYKIQQVKDLFEVPNKYRDESDR